MAILDIRLRALAVLIVPLAVGWGAPASAQAAVAVPSLSVTSMVGSADPLVKAVMAILLLASMASWTILIKTSWLRHGAWGRPQPRLG